MKAKLWKTTKSYRMEESKFKELLGIDVKENISGIHQIDGATEEILIETSEYEEE